METQTKNTTGRILPWLLTIVRILIGWHFLYEGIAKIMASGWSSAPYLAGSKWIFAPVFTAMAGNSSIIAVVDFINIWGMMLVGLGLILGLFSRWASLVGAVMIPFHHIRSFDNYFSRLSGRKSFSLIVNYPHFDFGKGNSYRIRFSFGVEWIQRHDGRCLGKAVPFQKRYMKLLLEYLERFLGKRR